MAFFDDVEPDRSFPIVEPRREPWRGVPEDSLGAPVPYSAIVGRSDEAAVVLSGLVAYPAGMLITVFATSRRSPARPPVRSGPPHRQVMGLANGMRFGIRFADGTKVSNLGRLGGPAEPGKPVLRHQGGSGGGRGSRLTFWVEPLPPEGLIAFVCDWEDYGVVESTAELDAAMVLEAASRAVAIWPDDVGLPEPPEQIRPADAGWVAASSGGFGGGGSQPSS